MSDPKPCPVCGGTEFSVEYDEREDGVVAFLMCDDCDGEDNTRGPIGKPGETEDEAEDEAIYAWNRFVDKRSGR